EQPLPGRGPGGLGRRREGVRRPRVGPDHDRRDPGPRLAGGPEPRAPLHGRVRGDQPDHRSQLRVVRSQDPVRVEARGNPPTCLARDFGSLAVYDTRIRSMIRNVQGAAMTAHDDKTVVIQTLRDYYAASNKYDLAGMVSYYHEPVMFITAQGVASVATH